MATITKKFCDKCKHEIKDTIFCGIHIKSRDYTVDWDTRVEEYKYREVFDLCSDCKKKLEQWIKGEGK